MATSEQIIAALKEVEDPEIPINVWDLGLIYDHKANPDGSVWIKATMTSPSCPYASSLMAEMKSKVAKATGAHRVDIELTFSPMWSTDRMTEEGKAMLEVL